MTRGLTLIAAALIALAPVGARAQTTDPKAGGTAAGAATTPAAPATKPAAPAVTVTPYGFVQLTADLNAGNFDNGGGDVQYPGVVALNQTATTTRSFLMHARNSRFGVRLGLPNGAFGAKLGAVFEVDFRGGFPATSNVSWYQPLPRLRLAYGTATWGVGTGYNVTLLAGQEYGLVTPLFATSAAYTGDPIFWKAGNTWHRTPQLRLSGESTGPFGILWQAAVLSPLDSGTPAVTGAQATETPYVGPGNRSRRPDLEGRLAVNMKNGTTKVIEVGVGGHLGWERYSTTTATDPTKDLRSEMVGVDLALNFGLIQFKGEAWRGSNVEDYFTVSGGSSGAGSAAVRSLRSRGVWGQLVLQPTPMLQIVGGAGMEQPNRDDVTFTTTARLMNNRMLSGGIIANPSKNWRAGVEVTKTLSQYRTTTTEVEKQAVQTAITTAFIF